MNKMFFNFKTRKLKYSYLNFDKIFYTSFECQENSISEEQIFNKSFTELGLKDKFLYEFTYVFEDDRVHTFFTLFEDLEENDDFIIAEPLLYKNLFRTKIAEEENIGIIILHPKYCFISFFRNKHLIFVKNIPKYTSNFFAKKNIEEKEKMLEEFLAKTTFRDLCEKFSCKEIFIKNPSEDFSILLQKKLNMKCRKLSKENEFLLLDSCEKDLHHNSNFLRHSKKENFNLLKMLIYIFILTLIISLVYPSFKLYKENLERYEIRERNIFLNENISSLNLNEEKLNILLDEIENNISKNQSLLVQKESIVLNIMKHFQDYESLKILENFLKILEQYDIKLTKFKLIDKEIHMLTNILNSEDFIKNIYLNPNFILKNKTLLQNEIELILEFKDD